jgi:hypothetical protein
LSFWLESCIRSSFPSSEKRVPSFTRKRDVIDDLKYHPRGVSRP